MGLHLSLVHDRVGYLLKNALFIINRVMTSV